jgi:hypothetical protein
MMELVAQDGSPGLAGGTGCPQPPVSTDLPRTYYQAKLEQLADHALRAPQRVLARDSGNQRVDLF